MKDEHKTKKQILAELMELRVRVGDKEALSQLYKGKVDANAGIEQVKKNAVNDAAYERKTSVRNEPFFVLKATNGQTIGKSEMYKTEAAMEKGIASVKNNAPGAGVKDLSA